MGPKFFGGTIGGGGFFGGAKLVLISAFILILPTLINARPFLFPDSPQYFDIGQSALSHLGLGESDAHHMPQDIEATATEGGLRPSETVSDAGDLNSDGGLSAVAGSRSVWYSILVYGFATSLSLWGLIYFQALIVSWLILRAAQAQFPERSPLQFFGLIGGLTLLSPLGFHVGIVMPDVLAGAMLLGIGLLVFGKDRSWIERLVLMAIIGLGAMVHSTSLIVGLVCVVLLGLYRVFPKTPLLFGWLGLALAATSVIGAGAINKGYAVAAEKVSGDALSRPPFLMARVIADGPGRVYLERVCAEDPKAYTACLFNDYTYEDHNDILWAGETEIPRVSTVDVPVKLALLEEEKRFVLNAIAEAPLKQFGASLKNFSLQLVRVGIHEADDGIVHLASYETWRDVGILRHVGGVEACANNIPKCQTQTWPLSIWKYVVYTVTLVVFTVFVVLMASWLRQRLSQAPQDWRAEDRFLVMGCVLLLVLLANAALCGILSGAHHRYQARLIWLVPLFLVLTQQSWRSLPLVSRFGLAPEGSK